MTGTKNWEELVKKAQSHREQTLAQIEPSLPSVPAELPLDVTDLPARLLAPEEVEITERHDATSLAAAIAAKKYSAEQVIKAFLRRAGLAQKLVIPCCNVIDSR
jgi:amidase